MNRMALLLALVLAGAGPASALSPSERLPDATQEQRARDISAELRCLVCQNQSIDDSDAELARDLRRLVRERIAAGDSDRAVKDFLVARYGEFVLLRPVFSARTLLLWGLPFVALLAGIMAARRLFRRPAALAAEAATELSAEEQAEIERITKNS